MIKTFKDLDVRKKSIELVLNVYDISKSFPDEEKFNITSQIRRSSVSIPSNISEGFGRGFTKDRIRFLGIARGSCCELETQIIISTKLDYLNKKTESDIIKQIHEITKMTTGLMTSINKKI